MGGSFEYTAHGHKLNFSNKVGGQEKDFAHPTFKTTFKTYKKS